MNKSLGILTLAGSIVLGMLGTMLLGLLACSNSAFAQIGFKPVMNCPIGSNPYAVGIGDLNADGKIDLEVAFLATLATRG